MKPCKKCGSTEKYKNGQCKPCQKIYLAAYYKANIEKSKAASIARRKNNPDKMKAYDAAYYQANREKIKTAQAVWRIANPEKCKAANAAWRKANPERAKAANSAWAKANPEKQKAAETKYRKANVDKVRVRSAAYHDAHREQINARSNAYAKATNGKNQKAYRASHPEKNCQITAKRRSTKLQATPVWANEFFIAEIFHLAKIREKATGFKWHVDHIVPLNSKIVCGLHVEHNLQVVPAAYNMLKGNRNWPDMP